VIQNDLLFNIKKNIVSSVKLKRSLTLPLLVIYGLGATIGAGIYVLIGAAAGQAGIYAPLAFIFASIGVVPTALTYAELSSRLPVSAGEAAYVEHGFNKHFLTVTTGLMVILSGIVAAATISIGCAGYLGRLIDVPQVYLIIAVVALMGMVAIWGILESVLLAALFTLIEASGLIALIYFGFTSEYLNFGNISEVFTPNIDTALGLGIVNASMVAIFAFIGFEDIVNVAEETRKPRRTLPLAIFLTLAITTILYTLVTLVAVLTISPDILAQSEAPLADVFNKLTDISPHYLSLIAIFATANTILAQFIMVSRVIYGMAEDGKLPNIFQKVNHKTQTPVLATLAVMLLTLILALAFPLDRLAEITAQIILFIWTLANLALLRIKLRKEPPEKEGFIAPIWVPIVGVIFCIVMIVLSLAA